MKTMVCSMAALVLGGVGCSGSTSGGNDMGPFSTSSVVVNEVSPHGTSSADPDFAELKNNGKSAADLTGYKVRDGSLSNLFRIPDGTTIGPGEYLVIFADDQADGGVMGGLHVPWKFSSKKGDEFHLVGPDGKDVDGTAFAADLASTKSWGRLPDGTGSFIPTTPTRGTPNI